MKAWLAQADRNSPWSDARVVVAGLGVSGYACADALLELGAKALVLDDSASQSNQEKAKILTELDGEVRLGPGSSAELPEECDLVIASPGWRPDAPLLAQAADRQIPIWSEVELAWHLMHPDRVVPWIGVTGTNGKTTTTQMLASMLNAAGLKVATVGNIGRPIIEAINDEIDYDVFAIELSSFQLHWTYSVELYSAAVLNVHPDHLEWYGPWAGESEAFHAYQADKARIYHLVHHACVYNVAEQITEDMVADADVTEGARAIGFTTKVPAISMVGVVDDLLVDRAFVAARKDSALPMAKLTDINPLAPHNIENALAAAALARSFGVPAKAIAQGLQDLKLGGHRIELVAEANQVKWVDDSKATNPHAANSSMRAFDSIVWLAGGQAKGTNFDELIALHAPKLRGVVIFGIDRDEIAASMAKQAPQVPVVVLDDMSPAVIKTAVNKANEFTQAGDVVLLAPGCASKDIWSGYDARGNDFAAAVHELIGSDADE